MLQKPALRPMQPPQPYSSNPPYGGSGPPPASMYMGMPHYGSSVFNGSSIPPYEVPYSGGSAYHYNYGNRISGGSPYRPMPLSGPPPYSGGSMMGNGTFFSFLSLSFSLDYFHHWEMKNLLLLCLCSMFWKYGYVVKFCFSHLAQILYFLCIWCHVLARGFAGSFNGWLGNNTCILYDWLPDLPYLDGLPSKG